MSIELGTMYVIIILFQLNEGAEMTAKKISIGKTYSRELIYEM